MFFGAVAGSTPIVIVLIVAVLSFALIEMVGRKVKGDDMEKPSNTSSKVITIATKCMNMIREFAGQSLITTAAIGSGMTAGVAGLQL